MPSSCEVCRLVEEKTVNPGAADYHCLECGIRVIERDLEVFRRFGGDELVEQIKDSLVERWVKDAKEYRGTEAGCVEACATAA